MKQHSKLSQQQQQQAAEQQARQQTGGRDFASPEEMLRHDARQTKVPPGIGQRLGKSTGGLPQPKSSWWRRLFGK